MTNENDLDRVVEGLNIAEANKGYTHPDTWFWKPRGSKFVAIDIGRPWNGTGELRGSGAFLVARTEFQNKGVTIHVGDILNIKGYGVPDYNKFVKANLGNIATVDPAWLHLRRWNYLR